MGILKDVDGFIYYILYISCRKYTAITFRKNRPEYLADFCSQFMWTDLLFSFFLQISCTFRTEAEEEARRSQLEAISPVSSAQLSLPGHSLQRCQRCTCGSHGFPGKAARWLPPSPITRGPCTGKAAGKPSSS